ncbi:hypothetical protein [Phytoactinopolyspora halotolerans]|uniref:Uncharacterized protein n=1 Tax=Phytoactinopolyspora halotolerans TaxID=1981512 RepID=A0A6L9SE88_9ACTN|nr:hypothetical protein [Phytoactinopolyspora halotolerans]NEE02858.1 hypothetical protein [Phytoactinopolyspora halotolerans]
MTHGESTPTNGPAAGSDAGAQRGTSPIVVAAVALAAVAGGLVAGYLIFDSPATSDATAASHVDHACAIADQYDGAPLSDDSLGGLEDDPWFWEGPAMGYLLSAAAVEDSAYESLSEHGRGAVRAVGRIDVDGWNEAIEGVLAECADR